MSYTPYKQYGSAAAAIERSSFGDEDDDLDQYQDEDLLRHLGFADDAEVSDAELRAVLEEREHAAIEEGSDQLANFYSRVHARFFLSAPDDEELEPDLEEMEVEEEEEEEPDLEESRKRLLEQQEQERYDAKRARMPPPQQHYAVTPTTSSVNGTVAQKRRQMGGAEAFSSSSSFFGDYRTFSRIVVLDSQTRDVNQKINTSYMFDLSEKLQRVVKISLQSIVIPYHWYTIGNAYGSNFIYLVPTAAGIAGVEENNIQISVPPGNYLSNDKLVQQVNESMIALPESHPYIKFSNGKDAAGKDVYNTTIANDTFTNKATLNLGFQNIFEDPHWVLHTEYTEYTAGVKEDPVSKYLGLAEEYKRMSCIFGDVWRTYPTMLNLSTSAKDVKIVHYTNEVAESLIKSAQSSNKDRTGIPLRSGTSTILGSPEITGIILAIPALTNITITYLLTKINDLMAAEPRLVMAKRAHGNNTTTTTDPHPLSGSYISLEERTRNNISEYRVVWSIQLARLEKQNPSAPRAKLAIELPDNDFRTLLGFSSSSFSFSFPPASGSSSTPSTHELQLLRAEKPLPNSNFVITADAAKIKYSVDSKVIAVTDLFTTNVAASGASGYTVGNYIKAINDAHTGVSGGSAVEGLNVKAEIVDAGDFRLTVTYAMTYGSANFKFKTDTVNPYFSVQTEGTTTTYTINFADYYDRLANNRLLFEVELLSTNFKPNTIIPVIFKNLHGKQESIAAADLLTEINSSIQATTDEDGYEILKNCSVIFGDNNGQNRRNVTIVFNPEKKLTQADLKLELTGASWKDYLYVPSNNYTLRNNGGVVTGTKALTDDLLYLSEDVRWTWFAVDNDASRTSDLRGAIPVSIVVPGSTKPYTRDSLFDKINAEFALIPELAGSCVYAVKEDTDTITSYCRLRLSMHRVFGIESYQLVFYSPELFQRCVSPIDANYLTANVKPTQTLGWMLGFHAQMAYDLVKANVTPATQAGGKSTYADTNSIFTLADDFAGMTSASLAGDATVNVNPYTMLYLTLDDFSQNRSSDGVVSIGQRDTQYNLPFGSSRQIKRCNPISNKSYVVGSSVQRTQVLTRKAMYAQATILAATEDDKKIQQNSTTTNAAVDPADTFAVLALDLSNTKFGETYSNASESLARMYRKYTGPIKFARGRVQLLTDRGVPLDLNGQNWSVVFNCELAMSNN